MRRKWTLVACMAFAQALPALAQQAKMPSDADKLIVEARIDQVQQAVVQGKVTCEAVTRAYLARIATYDKSAGLNAITVTNPDAIKDAQHLDEVLHRKAPRGALFCVPTLVKDNIDTAGMATSAGSKALMDNVPTLDAFIVRRLKAAGAIVLAKTNMAEWAFSPRDTVSSSYGITANAYDRTRTPAGSSGGTAVGIAANFGLVGLGTDTGNSVRGPSSFAALVGLRPTLGLVSRSGIVPLQLDRDTPGPITRTVEDNARLLNVMAGEDPDDAITNEDDRQPRPDYVSYLKPDALKGARIGVLRALAPADGTDPGVLASFEGAIRSLREAGAIIVDPFVVPHLEAHIDNGYYCSRFAFDANNYLEHSSSHLKNVAEIFGAGLYAAHNKTDFQRFLKDSATDPSKANPPCAFFLANPGRLAFLQDVTGAMDRDNVAAVIYPTWRFPPPPLKDATKDYRGDNSQLIAPTTGMPAITVPSQPANGLPVGLQILARRYGEGTLYALAYSYEQKTHWRWPPPGLDPLIVNH